MKKFGLIGGTSWRSTVEYYETINTLINQIHRDNTNPPLTLMSLNQKEIHSLQSSNNWIEIGNIFVHAALELETVGVKGIALCANTPHKVYEQLQNAISVPIIHIGDAVGTVLKKEGLNLVGLIGTCFTMREQFIRGKLSSQYNINTVVPSDDEQNQIQRYIYEQLSIGKFESGTRDYVLKVISSLQARGAQAVILGCTEFPLLLEGVECPVRLIDALSCHCSSIVNFIVD